MKHLIVTAAFLAATALSSGASAAPVYPAPQEGVTSLTFGDFTVYSLAYLNYRETGSATNGSFEVQSTPGQIQDLIVVATGANGNPVNTNFAGMDNAFETPNAGQDSAAGNFVMTTGNEPGQVGGAFAGDNAGKWDTTVGALRNFLTVNGTVQDFVLYFNLNESNNASSVLARSQDLLAFATVTIGGATFEFKGGLFPGTGYGPYDFDGAGGDPAVSNAAYVHGEICVDSVTRNLLALGPCSGQPNGVNINQNLGADRAAFAVTSAALSDLIRSASAETVLSIDLSLGELSNGYEQVFIDRFVRPTPPGQVPEPATLMLLGLGMAGLAAARRRKA